jgi:hypothetical protein
MKRTSERAESLAWRGRVRRFASYMRTMGWDHVFMFRGDVFVMVGAAPLSGRLRAANDDRPRRGRGGAA